MAGGVHADARLQVEDTPLLLGVEPVGVPASGRMSPGVLDEGRIHAQIRAHRLAAARAARHESGGDAHVPLPGDHHPDQRLVVVGGVVAGVEHWRSPSSP